MKHPFRILFLITVVITNALVKQAGAALTWPSIDTTGTQTLRRGNYADALDAVLSDKVFADTTLRYFKLGCAHEGLENFSKAIFYFKLAAKRESVWNSLAYEKIGDIELSQGRWENALKTYRAALDGAFNQRYQHHLYGKMFRVRTEHADTVGNVEWLDEIVGPPPAGVEVELMDLINRYIEEKNWGAFDSLVENILDTARYNRKNCDIATRLIQEPVPDSVLTTKSLYKLSKIASLCRNYEAASDWLLEALSRTDFATCIDQKSYLYYRAELTFKQRNYNKALRWLRKYEKNYGLTPEVVYTMARCYRSMGKNAQANTWYTTFIKKYPRHRLCTDIIWYLAWLEEDEGNEAGARKWYGKLSKEYKGSAKAEEAFFRYALSYMREEKYDSALTAFTALIKNFPRADFELGASYWKAKCQLRLQQLDTARLEFVKISQSYPSDYYGYKAREMLAIMGDSAAHFSLDSIASVERALRWLDSIAMDSTARLGINDSIALITGLTLMALGMDEHAGFFIEPLEMRFEKYLPLQFSLAQMHLQSGDVTRSYTIARQFAWRIPQENRNSIPLPIYQIMYPLAFSEHVGVYAKQYDVESELIYAIMRQESIFKPHIVSPVGAIGLMQIMPYTGKEIAKDLNDTFSVDSLYVPRCNVQYGCYYVHKLLQEFSGNIICAIASYNGGPHNVKKWLAQSADKDLDLFVEDIGFAETRTYVKKVLANYWQYKQLAKKGRNVER